MGAGSVSLLREYTFSPEGYLTGASDAQARYAYSYDALGLPTGERDLPLMITDRAFASDGSLRYPALDPTGLHTPDLGRRRPRRSSSFRDWP